MDLHKIWISDNKKDYIRFLIITIMSIIIMQIENIYELKKMVGHL